MPAAQPVNTRTRGDLGRRGFVFDGRAALTRAGHYLATVMTVPVLLFASYADAFGARSVAVPVETPCSVGDVIGALRRLPGGHVLPETPLVAVNHAWVRGEVVIGSGDEVAVIPPVAGG